MQLHTWKAADRALAKKHAAQIELRNAIIRQSQRTSAVRADAERHTVRPLKIIADADAALQEFLDAHSTEPHVLRNGRIYYSQHPTVELLPGVEEETAAAAIHAERPELVKRTHTLNRAAIIALGSFHAHGVHLTERRYFHAEPQP